MAKMNMRLGTRHQRRSQATCAHEETISVTHAGIERILCQHCSELRIEYRSEAIRNDPDRERFSREIDELGALDSRRY